MLSRERRGRRRRGRGAPRTIAFFATLRPPVSCCSAVGGRGSRWSRFVRVCVCAFASREGPVRDRERSSVFFYFLIRSVVGNERGRGRSGKKKERDNSRAEDEPRLALRGEACCCWCSSEEEKGRRRALGRGREGSRGGRHGGK